MIHECRLLSSPTTQIQELWTSHIGSNVEDPRIGQIRWGGLFFSIILHNGQQNWLLANLPTPNIRDRWKIKTVKLRIRTEQSPLGGIDKVRIRDGENLIHEFGSGTPQSPPLAITSFNRWQVIPLDLPLGPRSFASGLGVTIHMNNRIDTKQDPPHPLPPVRILVSAMGAEFINQVATGTEFNTGIIGTVISNRRELNPRLSTS